MFENQPKGLWALALANTGERFGYYTMLAIFVLFLQSNFGWGEGLAGTVYSTFLMFVYFLPIAGGAVADKIGFGRCVTTGILVMFLGYLLLAIPAGRDGLAIVLMAVALLLVCVGTSLFKGNLQVMVGNLYDDARYAAQRDSGFSIFYMAINIGALFAPTAAIKIMQWAQTSLGASEQDAYHYAFGVACLSLIVSIAIYYIFRWTFAQVDNSAKKAPLQVASEQATQASPAAKPQDAAAEAADTHSRLVALFLVFAVVIFFWMAFHQNGLTLTYFARDFVQESSTGWESMLFDVTNLVACIFIIYALFAIFQSKTARGKVISVGIIALAAVYLGYHYLQLPASTAISAPIFQQFNPCFVVALTPVSMALFAWLARRGKEPSAPRKIGYGMLVAGCAYVIMIFASIGLVYDGGDAQRVSPMWLITTYLVLTFAELLLSPMGISFVSKVAPLKYKGLMMGCWFGATAIGNFLVQIPAYLWRAVPLTVVWGVLVALCVASFLFIFSVMKRLEKVC